MNIDAIERLLHMAREGNFTDLTPLQRSEREEEMTIWFDNHSVAEAWEISGVFTFAGLQISDLERFAEVIPNILLGDALAWVAGYIEIDQRVAEINHSAKRVSELVSSIKIYSHMDQSSGHKPTDVCEGLEITLQMFGHKLKQKNKSRI